MSEESCKKAYDRLVDGGENPTAVAHEMIEAIFKYFKDIENDKT